MNYIYANGASGSDVRGALTAAVAADEQTLFGSNPNTTSCGLNISQLAAPTGAVITNNGTPGATAYGYVVADIGSAGLSPAVAATTATGPAVLSAANSNTISFNGIANHTYGVFRASSAGTPAGLGLIATVIVTLTSLATAIDIGQNAASTFVPTLNTTGGEDLAGPSFAATYFPGGTAGLGGKVVVSSATGVTLTASQLLADILVRTTGAGAISDATPTAAALVAAAGPNVAAGSMHTMRFRNEGAGVQTITAGTGVTLRAGNTNTIGIAFERIFDIVFTTVTPGAEAVEVISGVTSAY